MIVESRPAPSYRRTTPSPKRSFWKARRPAASKPETEPLRSVRANPVAVLVRRPQSPGRPRNPPEASGRKARTPPDPERTWTSPYGLLHGLAVDPANGNMWITHDSKPLLYVVSPAGKTLQTSTLPGVGWGVAM